MFWDLLGILYIVCAVMCAVGFYKFVYFLSIGYGFAVAGGGIAILVMALINPTATPLWIIAIQALLFLAYGARLSGFLLVREFKNATFKKTDVAKDTLAKNGEKKMPVFVLATIWIFVSALYVAQVSPMLFRYANEEMTDYIVPVIGFALSVFRLILESVADKQKSAQKKENPSMVATKGLYRIVRCPNYLGEILMWWGVALSVICAAPNAWYLAAGALANTMLFFAVSIPMADGRQSRKEGFTQYKAETRMLLPIRKFK